MSLQVESEPPQSFAAGYELSGNAERGELALFTPLGGTIAVLAWQPGTATLRANGRTQQYDSLDTLAERATGTAVPVAALFGWLRGDASVLSPGWRAELSQLSQGRLSARRTMPAPEAVLRMVIDER